jgi:hypothetical protein
LDRLVVVLYEPINLEKEVLKTILFLRQKKKKLFYSLNQTVSATATPYCMPV